MNFISNTRNIIIIITKDYHHHGGSAYASNARLDLELSRKEEVAQQVEIQSAPMSDKEDEQAEEKRKSGLRKRYSVRSSIGGPSSGAI